MTLQRVPSLDHQAVFQQFHSNTTSVFVPEWEKSIIIPALAAQLPRNSIHTTLAVYPESYAMNIPT